MERQKETTSEVVSKPNISNSFSIFHNNEDTKSEEPILIKTSFTKKIYHGGTLKSRIKLSQCQEISRNPDESSIFPSLLPLELINSEEKSKKLKVKKFNIRVSSEHQEEKRSYLYRFTNIFAVIFILVVLGRYIFPYIRFSSEPISVHEVEEALHTHILNQKSSIATVIRSLKKLYEEPPKQVLTCLVGPTGVGKSHLVNILNKQISSESIQIFHNSNLLDLSFKESTISKELRGKLYFSDSFIVVLDDLKIDDIERLKKFIEIIFSIGDPSILLLTVFNIETEDCLEYSSKSIASPSFIKEKLENLSEHFYFTHFDFLNETIVKLWLKKELEAQNVTLGLHDEIVDRLLKRQDIKCHGLKGVHSKLLLQLSSNP